MFVQTIFYDAKKIKEEGTDREKGEQKLPPNKQWTIVYGLPIKIWYRDGGERKENKEILLG